MQVVDVLRDYGGRLAGAVEARERKVAAARLGGGEWRVHGKSPPPRLVPHLLAREELVERDRPVLRPEPAGRAEIGDAALGGNPGTGERGYDARAPPSPAVRRWRSPDPARSCMLHPFHA